MKKILLFTLATIGLSFLASSCVKEEGFENRVREITNAQYGTLVTRVDSLYKEQVALNDSLKNVKKDVEKLSKQSKDLTDSIAAVKDSLAIQKAWTENELKEIDDRVTALETEQKSFKAEVLSRLDKLESRIQKIDVIPQYSDGSVWVDKQDAVVNFIVRPDSVAQKLVAAHPMGDSTFTFLAVKTLTKSATNADTVHLDIKNVSYENGIVSVKVNGSRLDPLFFEGKQSYSGCLIIGDGNSDNASGFFQLYFHIPEGALSGLFTTDANGTMVRFSKGNLYYDTTSTPFSFKFVDNQYSSFATYSPEHFSHLNWAKNSGNLTNDIKEAIKVTFSIYGNKNDVFFTNATYDTPRADFTANGSVGIWRTLSSAEWSYLLSAAPSGRGTGDTYFKTGVTVCDTANCLIIAPDGNTTMIVSSYDAAAWSIAEANGFVCLPAAGRRTPGSVTKFGEQGYYWSSTASSSGNAYRMQFTPSITPASSSDRCLGSSVRLVTKAK